MNNLFEFTENELKEVDKLVKHYNVETRAQAMRLAIKSALADVVEPYNPYSYTDEETLS